MYTVSIKDNFKNNSTSPIKSVTFIFDKKIFNRI